MNILNQEVLLHQEDGGELFRFTRAELSAYGDDGQIYRRVKSRKLINSKNW
jgi:hypothetical protein